MKHMTEKDDILLRRIANHLIINASFMDDIGLYHGKMGVVLFFAHYGRYTGESLYEDFAGELLDEVYLDTHKGLPVNFENGLCGIGWAIVYLLQNEFMEGDPGEILCEIDKQIMERDIRRITDQSIETGMEGISYYLHARLTTRCRTHTNPPFDSVYLNDWKQRKDSRSSSNHIFELKLMAVQSFECESLAEWETGLKNGVAGFGLNLMLK